MVTVLGTELRRGTSEKFTTDAIGRGNVCNFLLDIESPYSLVRDAVSSTVALRFALTSDYTEIVTEFVLIYDSPDALGKELSAAGPHQRYNLNS
eukprot:5821193-Amphidinium_carterae.1